MILASQRPSLSATAFLGCLLLFASCSKLSRGRRLLTASKKAYEGARSSLLAGDVSKARELSVRSVKASEDAQKLLSSTSLRDAAAQDLERSQILLSSFHDPEGAVRLWFQTTVEKDRDLNAYIFDLSQLFGVVCGAGTGQRSQEERERLETALLRAYQRTLDSYEDVLSNWDPKEMSSEIDGDEAALECVFELANVANKLTIYLRKRDGIWRAYDFATRGGRATDTAMRLLAMVGKNVDLAAFFEGKGLFEALSQVEEIREFDGLFNQRPLIGCYVRTTRDVTLVRKGSEESVRRGKILKIIDQNWAGSKPGSIMVRTPETDPRESAVGRISMEVAKVVGTDDSELWGISVLD